jgi:hypothetical protein
LIYSFIIHPKSAAASLLALLSIIDYQMGFAAIALSSSNWEKAARARYQSPYKQLVKIRKVDFDAIAPGQTRLL